MQKSYKKRADSPKYVSPKQLIIEGFETPFEQTLNPSNRWVVLANLIPWDEVCETYQKHKGYSPTGRHPISPRVLIGSIIIKHLCNLDDRETVAQISENIYMQYFLGYTSFSNQEPFDASLLTVFRKRLGMDLVNAINEKIVTIKARYDSQQQAVKKQDQDDTSDHDDPSSSNKGKLIMDATACPQDIAYPTDLDLLSEARVKSEQLIDQLYDMSIHKEKPRTYRQKARKKYLEVAQNRNKSRKIIRKAVGEQLRFLKRNIRNINRLLDTYTTIPLKGKDYKYLLVIQTLYQQQNKMFEQRQHSIDHRIVSIHQPHVRPIVRGKSQAKVEFGAKIQVSLVDGISFLDKLSWEAFNEGVHMPQYIEQYRSRFGFYPKEVLADKIYCTRVNRALLKEKGIRLIAKPLGRPPAVPIHLSPGERNPIEGKFGQAKTGYGLNRIKAKLMETSETWIASILLVLNLVKLAGLGFLWRIFSKRESFSASLDKWVIHRLEHFSVTKSIFQRRIYQLNPFFKSFENEPIFLCS